MPYIREKEEGKKVNESVRKLFVLLHGRPDLGVFEREPWVPSGWGKPTCFHPMVRYEEPFGTGGPGRGSWKMTRQRFRVV